MKSKNEAVVLATLIADWLNIYLPSLRSNSQHPQRSYKLALSLYACFLEREKGITFKELSKMCFSVGYIEEWLLWMKDKRGCQAITCNNRLGALRSLLKYMSVRDISFAGVYTEAGKIQQMKVPKKPVDGITRNGIKAILAEPDLKTAIGRRDLTLISLMYSLGARIDEILSIKMRDLHIDSEKPYVVITGKGRKTRIGYLLPKMITILKGYIKEHCRLLSNQDAFLFYSKYNGQINKMSAEAVSKRLKIYAKAAHNKCSDVPLDLHCHSFRHARAGHWLEDGLNIVIIKELLGHENLNTTMIYVGITTEQERKALASLEDETEKSLPKKWKNAKNGKLSKILGLDEIK